MSGLRFFAMPETYGEPLPLMGLRRKRSVLSQLYEWRTSILTAPMVTVESDTFLSGVSDAWVRESDRGKCMSKSSTFRDLFDQLSGTKGHTAHWPIVLRQLMAAEYQRQQDYLTPYQGNVALRRPDRPCRKPEEQDVRRLFKVCSEDTDSILTIGQERFLLLGWQWPNQGSHKGRRADLVGLNQSGGIVVFEAKRATNNYSPFMAVLEGLDYLVHLTLKANFEKIAGDFADRKEKAPADHPFPPKPFGQKQPDIVACHEVIVLAPPGYFATHTRSGKGSGRGHGWREFAGDVSSDSVKLSFRFAETEFDAPKAKWR